MFFSLYFQTFWPKRLNFFGHLKKTFGLWQEKNRSASGAVSSARQSMHTSGAWSGAFIAHSLAWKNDWDPKVSDGVLQCNTMFYQGHLNKHRPFKVWKTSTKLVRAFRSSLEWKIWTSTVTIHLCQRGAALQAVGVQMQYKNVTCCPHVRRTQCYITQNLHDLLLQWIEWHLCWPTSTVIKALLSNNLFHFWRG